MTTDDPSTIDPGIGIVLVDHGSRRADSNTMLEEVAALYAERTGHPIVEPAHMELAEPSLDTAFARCVDRGASTVVVQPYFLLPGKHWREDIPRLAAEAARRHPGVRWMVTAPLGLHRALVEVIRDRVLSCLACARGEADPCEVCPEPEGCALAVTDDLAKPGREFE